MILLYLFFTCSRAGSQYEEDLLGTIQLQLSSKNPQEQVTHLLSNVKQLHLTEQKAHDEGHQEFLTDCEKTMENYQYALDSARADVNLAMNDLEQWQKILEKHRKQLSEQQAELLSLTKNLAELENIRELEVSSRNQELQRLENGLNLSRENLELKGLLQEKILTGHFENTSEVSEFLHTSIEHSKQSLIQSSETSELLYSEYSSLLKQDISSLTSSTADLQLESATWDGKATDAKTSYSESQRTISNLEVLLSQKSSICATETTRYNDETSRRTSELEVIERLLNSYMT